MVKNIFKKVLLVIAFISMYNSLLHAQKPVARKGGSYVRTSLNAYSFNSLLNEGMKDPGKGMTMFQLLDFAAKNNFDAIDLTGYFFPGYPAVPTDDYINSVKRRAFQLGLD